MYSCTSCFVHPNKAEVSKVDFSSIAKSFNFHYFVTPIDIVYVSLTPSLAVHGLNMIVRILYSCTNDKLLVGSGASK